MTIIRGTTRLLWAVLLGLAVLPCAASAQTGETVSVSPRTQIKTTAGIIDLRVGQQVAMGDVIATGNTGQAQIIFPDETRIVVGPNSQLEISQLLFRNNGTARRFTVSAVRGNFRFISGKSPKDAYSLRTPTATMGVRGTSFDVAVGGSDETGLVVYTGEVRLCGRGLRCASVPAGCQTVQLDRSANFRQPETTAERDQILQALFPFAVNQDRLRDDFRTRTADCEGGSDRPLPVRQIALPRSSRFQGRGDGGSGGNPAE